MDEQHRPIRVVAGEQTVEAEIAGLNVRVTEHP